MSYYWDKLSPSTLTTLSVKTEAQTKDRIIEDW